MYALYRPFMMRHDRFYVMGVRDAELTKYTGNTNLAMKVSFINAIAGLADVLGADVKHIAEGIGSDPRIGNKFLHARKQATAAAVSHPPELFHTL